MHLKFEGQVGSICYSVPTVILAMGLPLALLPDVGVHYYPTEQFTQESQDPRDGTIATRRRKDGGSQAKALHLHGTRCLDESKFGA